MKKTFKRVLAGILILVTCMSSFVYGTEFDELYRGENLGALWYSEFDSDGTGVNQMEGLVYIDGVLTAVPAGCINPDVPGMAELEYGDLYSSNISVAPIKNADAMRRRFALFIKFISSEGRSRVALRCRELFCSSRRF